MKSWKALLVSFFVLASALIFRERDNLLFFLSLQAQVDPAILSEEYDPSCKEAVCDNKTVLIPTQNQTVLSEPSVIAAEKAGLADKRIEVDLTNQRLYAYEGEEQVYNFLVSTGKFNRTPTGRFKIWIKLRYTKMSGGSRALRTYYYLPNVPYVMYFYNDQYSQRQGYGIHGTYWHNNFGHPMSHGCINLRTPDAEKLYYWVRPDLNDKSSIRATEENPGTEVIIYGVAPKS